MSRARLLVHHTRLAFQGAATCLIRKARAPFGEGLSGAVPSAQPLHRRYATGLFVCLLCATARFFFPPLEKPSHLILAQLFDPALLVEREGWELFAPPGPRDGNIYSANATRSGVGSGDLGDLGGFGAETPHQMAEWMEIGGAEILVLALLSLLLFFLMTTSILMPIPNGCFNPLFLLGAVTGRLQGQIIRVAIFWAAGREAADALPAEVRSRRDLGAISAWSLGMSSPRHLAPISRRSRRDLGRISGARARDEARDVQEAEGGHPPTP